MRNKIIICYLDGADLWPFLKLFHALDTKNYRKRSLGMQANDNKSTAIIFLGYADGLTAAVIVRHSCFCAEKGCWEQSVKSCSWSKKEHYQVCSSFQKPI